MKTVRSRVRVYLVTLHCDCGGELKPTGMVRATHRPLYDHQCNRCGVIDYLDEIHPRQVFEVDESEPPEVKVV